MKPSASNYGNPLFLRKVKTAMTMLLYILTQKKLWRKKSLRLQTQNMSSVSLVQFCHFWIDNQQHIHDMYMIHIICTTVLENYHVTSPNKTKLLRRWYYSKKPINMKGTVDGKKSGDHQLRLVVYPIIYRDLYIPGGFLAGILNHQQ